MKQFRHHAWADEGRVCVDEKLDSGFGCFVNDEGEYKYGTKSIEEFKVATPEGKIEIQKDVRWKELLGLAEIFTGK